MLKYIIIFSFFLTGCSIKSYNKTTIYPDCNKSISYHSISTIDDCNCNDPFCNCSDGMYLQDNLGW